MFALERVALRSPCVHNRCQRVGCMCPRPIDLRRKFCFAHFRPVAACHTCVSLAITADVENCQWNAMEMEAERELRQLALPENRRYRRYNLLRRTFCLEEGEIVDGQAENEGDVDAVNWCERIGWSTVPLPSFDNESSPQSRLQLVTPARGADTKRQESPNAAVVCPLADRSGSQKDPCSSRVSPSATVLSTISSSKKTRPCSIVPSCTSIASTPQLCSSSPKRHVQDLPTTRVSLSTSLRDCESGTIALSAVTCWSQ